jgi:toxin CcdB
MAQFDVYTNTFGAGLLLDCQSDLLDHFRTRFVVPLLLPADVPQPLARLNPVFEIGRVSYMMVTHYAGAVEHRELGVRVGSLAAERLKIIGALDVLISGV